MGWDRDVSAPDVLCKTTPRCSTPSYWRRKAISAVTLGLSVGCAAADETAGSRIASKRSADRRMLSPPPRKHAKPRAWPPPTEGAWGGLRHRACRVQIWIPACARPAKPLDWARTGGWPYDL